jgi:hypothetical protein
VKESGSLTLTIWRQPMGEAEVVDVLDVEMEGGWLRYRAQSETTWIVVPAHMIQRVAIERRSPSA